MNIEISTISETDEKHIQEIMDTHGFSSLKQTQRQAFENDVLNLNKNHLLVAETGNGKTLCAEALTKKSLSEGNQVAYLVPSTQLVRDKKETIQEWIDNRYTVSSGRGKYKNSDVVVATFRSFYQAILRGAGDVRSFDLAILDDFHELYGSFIGPELEKSISAAMQYDIQLFGMSATIGNPEEISNWLDSNLTVSNESRDIEIEEIIAPTPYSSKKKNVVSVVEENIEDKEPVLVFNYAKSWTESRAESVMNNIDLGNNDINAQQKIENLVDGSLTESMKLLGKMIENRVAYHHSSLPRNVREWIEDLYSERKIDCLCATTTIAYGFDAPVHSVIVADMKRRGSWVGKWEYQQWIGRAARPGYGYDKGYAYVLTSDESTVRDEFFEPRELEPIQTHIESPQQFRKLILELIDMGWDTPEEIETFVKNTLYWEQLATDGAWGRSFEMNEKRVQNKLRETVNWLESRNFVRENRTSRTFESTNLGRNTVEFIFETDIGVTLSQIHNLYKWINKTDRITRLSLLCKVTDVFDLGISADGNQEIISKIKDVSLEPNRNTITAGILDTYWIENLDLTEIEKRVDVNSVHLKTITYRISDVLSSTSRILDSSSKTKPDWLDDYSYRINRGIKYDQIPYVRNVRGLGRSRVRRLSETLGSEDNLWKSIENYINENSSDEFKNHIEESVEGIGDGISDRVIEFHMDDNISSMFKS